jgi:hypothetical protein
LRTRGLMRRTEAMKHPMLGVLGLGFLGAAPSSTPVECGNPYVAFHQRLRHQADNMTGERLAALHRVSLRIFDACDAGHLPDVQAKFVELEVRLDTPSKCEPKSPSRGQSIELATTAERVQETGVAGYRPSSTQHCARPERQDD